MFLQKFNGVTVKKGSVYDKMNVLFLFRISAYGTFWLIGNVSVAVKFVH